MWWKLRHQVLSDPPTGDGEDIPLVSGKSVSGKSRWRRVILSHRFLTSSFLESQETRERRRKLHTSCVGAAAFMIRDAVLGEDQVEDPTEGAYNPYADDSKKSLNNISIQCRRWSAYSPLLKVVNAAVYALILLTFIEGPEWCRELEGGCKQTMKMQGLPAGGSGDKFALLYPTTQTVFVSEEQSWWIEATCLCIIAFAVALRIGRDALSFSRYLRPSHVRTSRLTQLVCLSLMSTALAIGDTRWQPYLRLALLMSFMTTPKREIRVLVGMLPDVCNILLLLFVITLFYAWFGVVMFVSTDEGRAMFPNLVEGMWTLWICITTANYPDVMMPGYNENRFVALYFISFMIISFFFLMNVILASVVDEYDNAVQKQKADYRDQATRNLKKAYKWLCESEGEAKGSYSFDLIERSTFISLFGILNLDFPELRSISEEETKLIFAVLDKDGSSQISEDEFMNLGRVLLLEFVRESDYCTFVERNYPEFYRGELWQSLRSAVNSSYYEYVIDGILVLNAVVVAIQSWPELSDQEVELDSRYWDGSVDTIWEIMETTFTLIYVLEAVSKIAANGWKRYYDSARNVFDFWITVMAIASSAIVYYPNEFSDSRLIRMILAARVLRLIRLLSALRPFQLIGRISAVILPSASSVLAVLFLSMYLFAALGMQLYGGLITRDPDNPLSHLQLHSLYAESNYWANNFNDMFGGMNVLFDLLVVNNWFVTELGYEAATQSRRVRLFFVAFHIFGVILVNNLVIAFIINKFLQQLTIFREDTKTELVDGDSTIIADRRALFDGSSITGTDTDLSGAYSARLRHSNGSMRAYDELQHDQLRRLFSRSNDSE